MKKLIAILIGVIIICFGIIATGIRPYSDDSINDIKEDSYAEGYEAGLKDADSNPYSDDEYKQLAEDGNFDSIYDWYDREDNSSFVYITPTGHCYHCLDCESLENTEYVKAYRLGDTPEGYSECPYCSPWQYE